MNYEQLLTAADQAGLTVKERPLQKHDGLIRGNRIAIRKSIDTQAEKSCVLAEELGHHGSLTVEYKKKCLQALWYLLFLCQIFRSIL